MSFSGSRKLENGTLRRSPRLLENKYKVTGYILFSNEQVKVENVQEQYWIFSNKLNVTFDIELKDIKNFKPEKQSLKKHQIPPEIYYEIFSYLKFSDLLKLLRSECNKKQFKLSKYCYSYVVSKYNNPKFRIPLLRFLWEIELETCGYCNQSNFNNEHWPNVFQFENDYCQKIYRPTLQFKQTTLYIELGCPFAQDDTRISLKQLENVIKKLNTILS